MSAGTLSAVPPSAVILPLPASVDDEPDGQRARPFALAASTLAEAPAKAGGCARHDGERVRWQRFPIFVRSWGKPRSGNELALACLLSCAKPVRQRISSGQSSVIAKIV